MKLKVYNKKLTQFVKFEEKNRFFPNFLVFLFPAKKSIKKKEKKKEERKKEMITFLQDK